jgi:hypothetical protein
VAFAKIHDKEGFDPDLELEDDIEEADETFPNLPFVKPSLFWKLVRPLLPFLLVGSVVAVVAETFQQENSDFLPIGFVAAICLVSIPLLAAIFRRHTGWLMAGILTLIPIVLTILGVISCHLIGTLTLGPVASVGIATLGLWSVGTMLQIVRSGNDGWGSSPMTAPQLAQQYVKKELKRSNPALDDAWMTHIVALGCYEAVNDWKQRGASCFSPVSQPLTPGQLPSFENLRAFAGDLSGCPTKESAHAFYVLSEEERQEWDDDEAEGKEPSPPDGRD